MIEKIFANRLKEARTASGLTQKQVGEKLGVTESCFQAYEYGKREPSVSLASRMADALGVSLDWLAGRV